MYVYIYIYIYVYVYILGGWHQSAALLREITTQLRCILIGLFWACGNTVARSSRGCGELQRDCGESCSILIGFVWACGSKMARGSRGGGKL